MERQLPKNAFAIFEMKPEVWYNKTIMLWREVECNMKNKLVVGILAHVDAGKTTLCEGLLYLSGSIRKKGRVDHGDSYLDNFEVERRRGITVFSKQALLSTQGYDITLIDTPGHVDFSTEAERVLSALDYAILVVSGSEGVQAHTETLWRLLERYAVPTYIFINKMDLATADAKRVMSELHKRLSEGCVDFSGDVAERDEAIALCDEALLNAYEGENTFTAPVIAEAVRERRLFPCVFGSAMRLDGVKELLECIDSYAIPPVVGDEFGAKVIKISRDAQGQRLTHMKITGGRLLPRTELRFAVGDGEEKCEKIAQIRVYSGARFLKVESAEPGCVCAVTGLTLTRPGQGLGFEANAPIPLLQPVLNYRIKLPDDCDEKSFLPKLRQLEDEDPTLRVEYSERLGELHVQLMGEIQTEILISTVRDRFGTEITVDKGSILYRETIASPVVGIGHYEPLRHYSEVHLLLEPLPAGSGMVFASACSQNVLAVNWQRLVLTHLYEKRHLGVLTGSPITDMKITLIAGRASLNHTEGGDFRQATYRAVRQGLMKAESVLLEPYYEFRLSVPLSQLGRAINDIRLMGGRLNQPEDDGEMSVLTGFAPVSAMRSYAGEVCAYTKGRGRISLSVSHYERCTDAKTVIEKFAYEPERDTENSPDSVFCAHGAGFVVKWDQVDKFAHIETNYRAGSPVGETEQRVNRRNLNIDEKELEEIMLREFGPIKRPVYGRTVETVQEKSPTAPVRQKQKDYLIVDGYNIIFGWESLRGIAQSDVALARKRLMELLSNYQGYMHNEVVLVFDGYRVKGNVGDRFNYHGIHVAYTKENETADAYIEKLIAQIGKNYAVRVASSDGLIQLSSVRTGVLRMTAGELEKEIDGVSEKLHDIMQQLRRSEAIVNRMELADKLNIETE